MCHTRELAFQIKNEYDRFAKYMDNVRTSVFFGGVTYVLHVKSRFGYPAFPSPHCNAQCFSCRTLGCPALLHKYLPPQRCECASYPPLAMLPPVG